MSLDLWRGLRAQARERLVQRDYSAASVNGGTLGRSAKELAGMDRSSAIAQELWIPGVEIFNRPIYAQPSRGWFSELSRQDNGLCSKIGLWPRQWAVSRMFAGTAKGFHIHPPYVPEQENPEGWFRRLYMDSPGEYSLRPYEREQWDLMFVVAGSAEMILVDERAGLARRTMQFDLEAGDGSGNGSVGVLIPPGVAHALRVAGSSDVLLVYGTTVAFTPAFEGRIASEVERHELPPEWKAYLG